VLLVIAYDYRKQGGLSQTSWLKGTLDWSAICYADFMTTMYCDDKQPFTPQRILAIGAHADDIDFGASGAIASWVKDGVHVEYLVITDGSKGSADPALTPLTLVETRQAEQRAAAKTLGVVDVHFLNYEDGALEITQALKKDIVRVIRLVRPDTVITLDPTMVYSSQLGMVNHPDHRATGQATLDALYPLARDHLSFPELLKDEQLEPHKVAHVLLIHLDKHNCLVDISGTIDLKLAALTQHVSQFADTNKVGEFVKSYAAQLGKTAKVPYAEGFVRLDLPA
jgi:LmbE family N-acetylglucosaminyl deacetylase